MILWPLITLFCIVVFLCNIMPIINNVIRARNFSKIHEISDCRQCWIKENCKFSSLSIGKIVKGCNWFRHTKEDDLTGFELMAINKLSRTVNSQKKAKCEYYTLKDWRRFERKKSREKNETGKKEILSIL